MFNWLKSANDWCKCLDCVLIKLLMGCSLYCSHAGVMKMSHPDWLNLPRTGPSACASRPSKMFIRLMQKTRINSSVYSRVKPLRGNNYNPVSKWLIKSSISIALNHTKSQKGFPMTLVSNGPWSQTPGGQGKSWGKKSWAKWGEKNLKNLSLPYCHLSHVFVLIWWCYVTFHLDYKYCNYMYSAARTWMNCFVGQFKVPIVLLLE